MTRFNPKLLLLPLIAFVASVLIGSLALAPRPAQAAPKFAATLTEPGDAGGTNTYRTSTQTSYLVQCRTAATANQFYSGTQVPYCYKVGTVADGGTLTTNCLNDYRPEVSTVTTSVDDAGLTTTITTPIPYVQVDLGPDNAFRARPVTDDVNQPFFCKLWYLPPVANSQAPKP